MKSPENPVESIFISPQRNFISISSHAPSPRPHKWNPTICGRCNRLLSTVLARLLYVVTRNCFVPFYCKTGPLVSLYHFALSIHSSVNGSLACFPFFCYPSEFWRDFYGSPPIDWLLRHSDAILCVWLLTFTLASFRKFFPFVTLKFCDGVPWWAICCPMSWPLNGPLSFRSLRLQNGDIFLYYFFIPSFLPFSGQFLEFILLDLRLFLAPLIFLSSLIFHFVFLF